jgi:hypothetical protein
MKDARLQKFVQLARSVPADSRVPYAFEKRIMAHLGNSARQEVLSLWSTLMWKAALACVTISICVGAWARYEAPRPSAELLASDLEEAVLAPVHEGEPW